MSKNTFKKYIDLLLKEEKTKSTNVLIKDFNAFVYDHTLHRGRKQFCRYFFQALSTEKILKVH